MSKIISGFSKLTKEEKIDWLTENYFSSQPEIVKTLKQYWNADEKLQQLHDDFIENTISNFYLPYGVAPNFVINDKDYVIPMVVEESSVVAAASKVAKYWSSRGGFKAEVIGTTKIGQVHFMFAGNEKELQNYFKNQKENLYKATASITKNMEKRGGGILDIELKNQTHKLENYYQLHVTFETKDSMGANFINSCLETIAKEFRKDGIEIVMSILSNYVPNCTVKASVSCKIEELGGENPQEFAEKFDQAVKIAEVEPYRAVTIAFAYAKKFSWKEVPKFIFVQILGALSASLILWYLFPKSEFYGATIPTLDMWRAFVLELILTYFLMLVIINVSTGSKEVGTMAGIAIGGVVLLEAMFAGPMTKASMNPARSIAPAIVSGHYEHLWLYIAAPIIGALLAVISCKLVKDDNCCEEGC